MTTTTTKYDYTIIYKIVCKDLNIKDLYVGHTTNFLERNKNHKRTYDNNKFNYRVYETIRKYGGWENWEMIEIEKYPCNDVNEAKSRERYYYELLNANLNKAIPIIFDEEKAEYNKNYMIDYNEENKKKISNQRKQFREENKEKLSLKKKEFYENNREVQKEKMKQYYKDNLEKAKAYREQNFICDCGSTVRIFHKHRHLDSLKHKSFILEQS